MKTATHKARTLGEATRIANVSRAAITPCFDWHDRPYGVFGYDFLDANGDNVATYILAMDSVQVFTPPRKWGLTGLEVIDVTCHLRSTP